MITPSKVSLRGLRTFCVAAKHQNFRAAGEELFITASAVSHQIKSLEQELDAQLFDRNSRELTLTDIGASLYAEVNPLIDQLDTVVAQYKNVDRRRLIRLSVQPFFASEVFVPRLSEFTDKNPNIDIRVGTSDEAAEKHPADADLSIRLFKSPPANLTSHLLCPLRLVPAASPEFKKKLRVKNKKIVSEFPVLVHQSHPKAWAQWASASGIQLPSDGKLISLDSMIAVARAAERGMGAALMPVPIANRWFESGTLVRLFDSQIEVETKYFLVYEQERAEDESIKLLRDWILANFTNL